MRFLLVLLPACLSIVPGRVQAADRAILPQLVSERYDVQHDQIELDFDPARNFLDVTTIIEARAVQCMDVVQPELTS